MAVIVLLGTSLSLYEVDNMGTGIGRDIRGISVYFFGNLICDMTNTNLPSILYQIIIGVFFVIKILLIVFIVAKAVKPFINKSNKK